ncbi:MAG TPA: SHOCT domain-containing protein [Acidimicrobiales bacterium]|nr:SHOCT domain-containing protein [Acidimicrobiales bacterium]
MHERVLAQARRQQQAFDDYVRQAAGASSQVDALAKLADLKEKGLITEAEFERQMGKLLA